MNSLNVDVFKDLCLVFKANGDKTDDKSAEDGQGDKEKSDAKKKKKDTSKKKKKSGTIFHHKPSVYMVYGPNLQAIYPPVDYTCTCTSKQRSETIFSSSCGFPDTKLDRNEAFFGVIMQCIHFKLDFYYMYICYAKLKSNIRKEYHSVKYCVQ